MKLTQQKKLAGVALVSIFILGMHTIGLAQGRGGGRPAGKPGSTGRPGGPPGVDRGLGKASEQSAGRSDRGLGTASRKSEGRSDAGLDRARAASENRRRADEELSRHPGIAREINISPRALRNEYDAALAADPHLEFGQFVSAKVLARNLGPWHPNITTNAILRGLAEGKSTGRTLQDLGLSVEAASEAERNADRKIQESKRRP